MLMNHVNGGEGRGKVERVDKLSSSESLKNLKTAPIIIVEPFIVKGLISQNVCLVV